MPGRVLFIHTDIEALSSFVGLPKALVNYVLLPCLNLKLLCITASPNTLSSVIVGSGIPPTLAII